MVRGWFVGDFDPVLLCTPEVEVAVQRYPAGSREAWHVHKVATEVTVIVSGRARMNGREFGAGEIVLIQPAPVTDSEALDVKGDKYLQVPPAAPSSHA